MRIWAAALALSMGVIAAAPSSAKPAAQGLYVAIGDSITFGYGLSAPGRDAFPYLVAQRLGVRVLDLGIPGVDARGALAMETPRVPQSATIITIFVGTNDADRIRRGTFSDAEFRSTYRTLIDAAHAAAPSARIYLLTPSTVMADEWGVNDFIRSQASASARLIDLDRDRRLHLHANYQPDFIHPNVAGQQRIASDVIDGLRR
ncbi:MAG: GDSL-like protein [Candidatus Eremiobacteraeota bacterium]|jgi:lysophospholipase L1-like esterase|nr:GDSL-like protein [Candidatus Eremiobacteraeota bacterium]